jgi:hypothetical protein
MRKISDNQKLVEKFKKRYWLAKRKEKGLILRQLADITNLNHKYLLTLINDHHDLEIKEQKYTLLNKLPRKGKYEKVRLELKQLWVISNYQTGKRLVGSIPDLIEALERHHELNLPLDKKKLLLKISAATIDRQLKEVKREEKQQYHGLAGTKPGNLLKSQIPIRTHRDWVEARPGYLEVDTVHHCLGDLSGIYALTLDTIDVYSSWNECQAFLGKNGNQVRQAISVIGQRLPFKIKGVDFDEGVEFVNFSFIAYCHTRHLTYTRSRTDHKNDQCYIEQNNDSVVRRYVGYARYTTKEEVDLLNALYSKLSDYYNFFQSVMKVGHKDYSPAHRTPTRYYPKAQTPYRRLLNSSHITSEIKEALTIRFHSLNPRQLRDDIRKLQQLLLAINRHYRPNDYLGKFSPQLPQK